MDLDYLREIEKSFAKAVAALPTHLQAKASDLHSTRVSGGRWEIFSSGGELLNPVAKPTPTVAKSAPARNMSRETQSAILRACARFTNKKIVEVFSVLTLVAERIEALEKEKAIDSELVDELAHCLERVDALDGKTEALQKDVADSGIRFKGYWRNAKASKKNDAYTHDGSLWIAIRDTDEKPSHESPDWNLIARKGRDGQ